MILKLKEYQTRKPLGPRPGAPGDDREGTEQDQNHCIDYGHHPESRWVPVEGRPGTTGKGQNKIKITVASIVGINSIRGLSFISHSVKLKDGIQRRWF